MRPRPFKPLLPPTIREWRFVVPFPMEASLRSIDGEFHLIGKVVNLSRSGMRIRARRHTIPVEMELEISLPEMTHSPLKLSGWVANTQGHNIGVQLDELCPDTVNLIAIMLTECEVFGACQGDVHPSFLHPSTRER